MKPRAGRFLPTARLNGEITFAGVQPAFPGSNGFDGSAADRQRRLGS
ncbi:hypothetical protein HDA40_008115 [Hamadaea flava]|uniref:Uncharacterized protein n=1 Tax=Hamadaea flava TaxID=1742688 RepID=A0ABV8LLJ7_9ACTN|nr:hypothetical protein [Hamadaea flava]MCP2329608.1 hypothetical protein [Hamadaea flava]